MSVRSDQPSEQRRFHHGDLRAALLEAAERTLRARGAAQLSLRDLAREVGVSHAAPRRHFPERQDLLDALAETGYVRLRERLCDAVAPHDPDFPTRIRRATSAFAHFATENPSLLELMNAAKHQPQGSRVPRSAAKAFEPLVDLIREGQAKRLLREGPFEDVGVVLYATINGLATLVNTGAIDVERLDELTDIALDQFLTGAITQR
ncbi:TetR/AcrR family transcriptional regulator [Curtobacterium aurantiacum]|uniref:TetR/AcrR family transcriptional regulator n=1 Tax=Curtobacterium aurantiacum TaxID=3236919 RepID=UPI001BE101A7|nr:TetR/AcrR family transcriptional regulator [Curtobacterium flaccumfaciens]MBT1677558.1 TetR/AcrR family transcriptional regulator [Curtobacterium flaccumfaciens pv. flaccumfaciens]